MCVGFAIVSMVGTNFHDSKLIKGESAPGPNDGPRAQVRSGPIRPRPFLLYFLFHSIFLIFLFIYFLIFFSLLFFIYFYSGSYYCWLQIGSCILEWLHLLSR